VVGNARTTAAHNSIGFMLFPIAAGTEETATL